MDTNIKRQKLTEYMRKWRKKNPVLLREQKRNKTPERQEKNRAQSLKPKTKYNHLLRKCKQRGFVCDIDFIIYEQLLKMPCHYCRQSTSHSGVSLDRKDNTVGYIISNVLPCCKMCNLICGTQLTVAETKVAILAIMTYRKRNLKED